jgi:hypothetical protein
LNVDLLSKSLTLLGADYDAQFLWDNLGRDGREAYYCSELITKVLNPFLESPIETKPMNFSPYEEDWSRFLGTDIPQGLPGNSPADFERSELFVAVGEYQGGTWRLL